MEKRCPQNRCDSSVFIKYGSYKRSSDSKSIQRFRCKRCGKSFSSATFLPEYNQKKRRINFRLIQLLSEGISQRAAARILHVSRKTIERRVPFLGAICKRKNEEYLLELRANEIQIDELITFEHTKYKPITVAAIVSKTDRKILGCQASNIPPMASLSFKAQQKYGPRRSQKGWGLRKLLRRVVPFLDAQFNISSDMDFAYPGKISQVFHDENRLNFNHFEFRSRPARSNGLGELKVGVKDPLFSINHTFAMMRAHMNRLFRRSWNTTKKIENLQFHLEIYSYYHNKFLTK